MQTVARRASHLQTYTNCNDKNHLTIEKEKF